MSIRRRMRKASPVLHGGHGVGLQLLVLRAIVRGVAEHQGLPLVHFSAQPEPLLPLTVCH